MHGARRLRNSIHMKSSGALALGCEYSHRASRPRSLGDASIHGDPLRNIVDSPLRLGRSGFRQIVSYLFTYVLGVLGIESLSLGRSGMSSGPTQSRTSLQDNRLRTCMRFFFREPSERTLPIVAYLYSKQRPGNAEQQNVLYRASKM